MKFYGSIADIPQLSTFSNAERRRIMRMCLKTAVRTWRFWLVFVAPFGLFFLLFVAVMLFTARRESMGAFTFICIAGLTMFTGFALVIGQMYYRFITPFVRELLPGYCSSCGYNLSGNPSGVCPECGTASTTEKEKMC